MNFQQDKTDAGLALALGVAEVRPVDLVTAYATLANGGKSVGHTTILAVRIAAARTSMDPYVPPAGEQVIKPAVRVHRDRHPAPATRTRTSTRSGAGSPSAARTARRPATLKTGTNNDAKDLNAYGYIAPPTEAGRAAGAYALAVGVWNGNSDNTPVSPPERPVFSIDVSTYVWQGFLQEASRDVAGDPVRTPRRPDPGRHRSVDRDAGAARAASRSTSGSSTGTEPKRRASPRTPAASMS